MTVARNNGWKFLLGAALVVTGVGIAVPRSLTAQASDAVRRGDLHERHRADSAAQLRELPSRRRRRADVARRPTRTCGRGRAPSSSAPASARTPA